jgi:teichuronic acid biosynthesis glycosyltransferase TuaC
MKVLVMTAMYPTPENPAFGSFIRTQVESLRSAGVEVEVLVLRGRHRKWNYLSGIFQLRRRLAKAGIDLVHAHYGLVGMTARMQWQVPVVVTCHGDDLLGTINEHGEKTPLSKLIAAGCRLLARHADAVIVQSKQMAEKLQRGNVHIIPHEIDFETFRPVEKQARAILGLDPQKKYLLFAANPQIPVKRFPLAKAVWEQLNKLDPSIELLTVYKEPQERLALIMNACDALVFTSYQEGSPNVVKQAMACNLPIVSTDVGDVREILGTTRGCYICKPEVAEFSACLEKIIRSRERTTGRENVRHLCGPAVAERIISIYEYLVSEHRGYAGEKMKSKVLAAGHETVGQG